MRIHTYQKRLISRGNKAFTSVQGATAALRFLDSLKSSVFWWFRCGAACVLGAGQFAWGRDQGVSVPSPEDAAISA